MHVSSLPWTAHKNPIDHITLSRPRQEIRPIVVLPQGPSLLIVACAPTHVPRFSRQVCSSFIHIKHLAQRVQTGLVSEVEAIVYSSTHFGIPVEVDEKIEIEFL